MAYLSKQCVFCEHKSKKEAAPFTGTDESGKPFTGTLYECENPSCPVYAERLRLTRKYKKQR